MSLRSALHAFFAGQAARQVIFANQDGKRPKDPFLTILPGPHVRIGEDWQSDPDEQGMARVVGHRELTVSVQFFGGEAFDDATALRDSFQLGSVRNALAAQGFVYVDAGGVNDLSGLLDSRWEQRAGFDLRLRFSTEQIEDTGFIETVSGTATVLDVSGQVAIQQDYETGV